MGDGAHLETCADGFWFYIQIGLACIFFVMSAGITNIARAQAALLTKSQKWSGGHNNSDGKKYVGLTRVESLYASKFLVTCYSLVLVLAFVVWLGIALIFCVKSFGSASSAVILHTDKFMCRFELLAFQVLASNDVPCAVSISRQVSGPTLEVADVVLCFTLAMINFVQLIHTTCVLPKHMIPTLAAIYGTNNRKCCGLNDLAFVFSFVRVDDMAAAAEV